MKNCAFAAAILVSFVVTGCNAGGDPGDPNVGAAPGRPVRPDDNIRPGMPGAPKIQATPTPDPLAGRTGAAAGQ